MPKVLGLVFKWWGILDVVFPQYLKTWFPLKWLDGLGQAKSIFFLRENGMKRLILSTKFQAPKFMDLPYEIRLAIYDTVCQPDPTNGSTPGVLHLLLLNKAISKEARPYFELIPHTVILADGCELLSDAEIWGLPRSMPGQFHHSIKRLVIVLSICSIGKMTVDTFDVNVPKTSRSQWYLLKKVVGLWPEIRQKPLEEIRISLRASAAPPDGETYRAQLLRYIRMYKRTNVWAESGDCGKGKRGSVVLPLARAFNEARRNWVEEATIDENMYVRFGEQRLKPEKQQHDAWAILPLDDTSRTDKLDYPPLTWSEEEYIRAKVESKELAEEGGISCGTCLARFYDRRVYVDHAGGR